MTARVVSTANAAPEYAQTHPTPSEILFLLVETRGHIQRAFGLRAPFILNLLVEGLQLSFQVGSFS